MSYYQGDYYQGDYYQGDYYQGDPFLGALIGMGASWLGKKLIGRGLTKTGQAAAGKMVLSKTGRFTKAAAIAGTLGAVTTRGLTIPLPGPFRMEPSRILPGGKPFIFREPGAQPGMMATDGCCPSGYHIAKDGSQRCVRNRSMNVANPRALRRSLRRVAGFGKLAARARRDIKKAAKSV